MRDQRPAISEEKAVLRLELWRLVRLPPPSVNGGGVMLTRQWVKHRESSMSMLKSNRSSVADLTSMISTMRTYEPTHHLPKIQS